jgi:UDP-glucose 4-epimerase
VIKTATGEYPFLKVRWQDYNTPDGTALRDYIHVMDLVQAHMDALTWIEQQKSWSFDVFNLGTWIATSVLEIIKTVEQVTGNKVPYEIYPRRAGDVEMAYADPKKANDILWWKSHYSVSDAIADMWIFESSKKSNDNW